MLGNRWPYKPPIGYEIDAEHPLAQGLVFFVPVWEGSGSSATDIVGGLTLPLTGAAWSAGASGGLSFTTTSSYAQATAPSSIHLPGPATIAIGLRQLSGTVTNGAYIGGILYDIPDTTPYTSFAL